MRPATIEPGERAAVIRMIAAEQVRPERNVPYLGGDTEGIGSELDALVPAWDTTVRVLRDDHGAIDGAVLLEIDADLGRAWLYGPWVAGDDAAWEVAAPALFDAALAQLTDAIDDVECSSDLANTRLQALATARGWRVSGMNQAMAVDAATVASWTLATDDVRPATADDIAWIGPLHDAEFPDTQTPADRLLESMTVLVTGDASGYVAGQVHPDGEGYIDYVGVDPARRRQGVGRRLLVAISRDLVRASPRGQVALTVDSVRAPAVALYTSLGFTTVASFVAYRS